MGSTAALTLMLQPGSGFPPGMFERGGLKGVGGSGGTPTGEKNSEF